MRKNHRKDVDKIIAFITKAAKGILKTDKFGKDMKYWYHDIKSAKRKPTKRKPAKRKHIPKAVRDAVMERDNYTCVYCASTNNPELDHNEAHANNGSDKIDNLQVLCRSCNRRKGAS
jgi:5-methylcytosine-specific restriction endonuclease McrA